MAQGTPDTNDPNDPFLAFVRQAAEGAYDVLGEMGRTKTGNVVYLARELDTQNLVAMKLSRAKGAQAGDEFSLEVVKTLDSALPGLESKCPECKATLPDFDRFCFRCGADLSSVGYNPSADEAAHLLEAVKEATAGEYEILGKMNRADGGGMVFFARDLKRGKLVALRLKQDASADPSQAAYSIGETEVFRPLAAQLGGTQVVGAYADLPVAPVVPPPPVPPKAGDGAPVPPLPKPAPGRRPPFKLIGVGIGAVVVAGLAFLVFRGDDTPRPAPPPKPVAPAPAPVPAPAPAPEPAPPPQPPPAAPAADSATVSLGIPVPAKARFTVDGRPVRGPTRVPVGSVQLELVGAGAAPIRERVALRAGQRFVWRPVFAAEPNVGGAKEPVPAPAPPAPPAKLNCQKAAARSDWTAAVELCRAEANTGDVVAQRTFAKMNDDGHGVAQDRVQAALWFEKSAAQGDHESQERLGYLYREGTGVKKDEKRSAEFFRQAAEGGLTAAALEYGVALDDGKGVKENDKEALKWYRKAADAGNPTAARRLGRLYERGDGTDRNEAEAAHWYRIAGDKGDAPAQYSLANLYKAGKGVEKSAKLALEWFKKAAAQNYGNAQDEVRKLEKP